ncbi:hypothetical protein BAE44_0025834 [Dichanthelium oligosanthes]|uniref:Uncharacterized protein n=1 Tax=Dichanthelium oligosanthes TaxID=888268 RepID=A0A1E5UK12_9POAL|nr:hypothetical protein BAE44_0025834 [Dichanthelium oligosanthes]
MKEREDEKQRAMWAETMQHRAEVQEPAFAILHERKASRPGGAMRKEPVTFSCDDAAYYRPGRHRSSLSKAHRRRHRELFDHRDLLATGLSPTELSRGWFHRELPRHQLALSFGAPSSLGCLPGAQHLGRVAVLCHNVYCDYVLAELYLCHGSRSYLASTKAILFLWWSPGSGPLAERNRWCL